MSVKFFLDTNVFVYTFDPAAPKKSRIAAELIERGLRTRQGIVSSQVIQEFFNVALRRFAVPFSAPECEQYLSMVFRPLWAVNPSAALFLEALQLRTKYQLAWYDSLIVAAAIEADCGVLYTEDLQQGREFGELRIQNPFL
jgi:predicted nucleic acid-binding protein